MLPPTPAVGQLVYDSANGTFCSFDGTSWIVIDDPAKPPVRSRMWRVQNERDMMVLLEEFGIESVVVRSQSAPGEVLVVVAPENVVLAAGVVSEMEPPAGVFLRVGPSPGPI